MNLVIAIEILRTINFINKFKSSIDVNRSYIYLTSIWPLLGL